MRFSVVGRDVRAEIFLAQRLERAVGAQLLNGGVDGGAQGGSLLALAHRDRNLVGIIGQHSDLDIGIGMLLRVVVEGHLGVEGRIDPAAVQQLKGLVQVIDRRDGRAVLLGQLGIDDSYNGYYYDIYSLSVTFFIRQLAFSINFSMCKFKECDFFPI